MDFKEVIGIDVSKNTIDVCIHLSQKSSEFANTSKGIKDFLSWSCEHLKDMSEVLFVYEHTGMYSHRLTMVFQSMNYHYYIAPTLDIKRSMGIVRGKQDKVDAKRIALYGYRLRGEITTTAVCAKSVATLKSLMALKTNMELMLSIKGVGRQMTTTMLIATENFTKFENSRKFASYCGVAPFPYQLGTSIKARSKVSPLANKKIKSLIHMCAVSAIQHNPEMKIYYQKRLEKGKSKMGTLNIIRNKLIARIFAVVHRQTPYVNTLKFVA